MRRLPADSMITGVANLVIPAAGAVSGLALASNFDPANRGAFGIAQLLPLFGATLGSAGAANSLAHFLPQAETAEERLRILRSASTVAASAMLPVLGLVLGLGFVVSRAVDDLEWTTVAVSTMYLPPMVAVLVVQGWLRGSGQLVRWNICRVLPTTVWAASAVIAFAIDASQAGAAALFAVSGLLGLMVSLIAARGTGLGLAAERSGSHRRIRRFGSTTVLASIPRVINLRLDTILIAVFLDAQSAGLYLVATLFVGLVPQLSIIRSLNVFTSVATSDGDQRRSIGKSTIRQAIKVGSITAGALAIFGPALVFVFLDDEYRASIPVMLALLPAAIILSVVQSSNEILVASGAATMVLRVEIIGSVAGVLVLALLLPTLGLLGAILASTASYALAAAAGLLFVGRL